MTRKTAIAAPPEPNDDEVRRAVDAVELKAKERIPAVTIEFAVMSETHPDHTTKVALTISKWPTPDETWAIMGQLARFFRQAQEREQQELIEAEARSPQLVIARSVPSSIGRPT